MRENYWDQFAASGKIEDYLTYRMAECSGVNTPESGFSRMENSAETGICQETCGKEKRESDCTYGHGDLNHANRGI